MEPKVGVSQNTIKNIHKKLQESRVLLQKKNIKKSGLNKFANYHYYELSDFIPSINEIFSDIGLASYFNMKNDTAELLIVNADKPEENVTFTSPLPNNVEIKVLTSIQNLGAEQTYMKRYLYQHALELVESDIVDNDAYAKPTAQQIIDKIMPKQMPQNNVSTTRTASCGRTY